MHFPSHVHDPLLNRLAGLVQQRSFIDPPRLWWITSNYFDETYLRALSQIAPTYGVRGLVWDDHYFAWSNSLAEKNAVADFLAHAVERGLCSGIFVRDRETKENLAKEFARWQGSIHVFSRERNPPLDAVAESFGGGLLPFLAVDRLLLQPRHDEEPLFSRHDAEKMVGQGPPYVSDRKGAAPAQETLIQIDRPGSWGFTLPTWGNVFGLSAGLLMGNPDAKSIEKDYTQTCFGQIGDEVHRAFELARKAIEKSFRVFDSVSLMDAGRWPRALEWFDRQVEQHPTLAAPTRNILTEIDLEKIDALEAAHDAWRILDNARPRSDPKIFLWLEHYFLNLKTVCHVLRLLTDVYFSIRGREHNTTNPPTHALKSKYKELYGTVRENYGLLAGFESRSLASGGHPMGDLLKAMADKIESIIMADCNLRNEKQ